MTSNKNLCCYIGIAVALLGVILNFGWNNISFVLSIYDNVNELTSFNPNSNVYLNGNFAPVAEEVNNIQLQVVDGKIPRDIEGLFLRVGPNPIPHHIDRRDYHWFDGDGMIHSGRQKGA